jgi:Fe-S-cluster containining protein
VTEVEILQLAEHLAERLASADLDALRDDVTSSAVEVEALDWSEQVQQRRPCVLLDASHRCIAYTARPIACRGWCSTSRASCEVDRPAADAAAFAACLGVHEALRVRGDGRTYELTSALARILAGSPLDGAKPAGGR